VIITLGLLVCAASAAVLPGAGDSASATPALLSVGQVDRHPIRSGCSVMRTGTRTGRSVGEAFPVRPCGL
jgi:hypothetical protein